MESTATRPASLPLLSNSTVLSTQPPPRLTVHHSSRRIKGLTLPGASLAFPALIPVGNPWGFLAGAGAKGPMFLEDSASGCLLHVQVTPRAARTGLGPLHAGRLKVAVQAPPTDGRANDAVCRYVAEVAGVPPSRVELLRGASSRQKTLRLEGVTAAELSDALRAHGWTDPNEGAAR